MLSADRSDKPSVFESPVVEVERRARRQTSHVIGGSINVRNITPAQIAPLVELLYLAFVPEHFRRSGVSGADRFRDELLGGGAALLVSPPCVTEGAAHSKRVAVYL